MKQSFLSIACLLIGVSLCFGQTQDLSQQFVDQVNAKWRSKDYAAIEQLINTRLQSNPNDVLALGVKAQFHVFAVNDLILARSAIESFNNLVQASNVQAAKELSAGMKDEIWAIPLTESGPLPPEEQNELHTMFPKEMPMIKQVLGVARALTSPSP